MQRGFIPILIAIIIVAVLSGGAFVAYEVSKPSQDSFQKEIVVENGEEATTTANTSVSANDEYWSSTGAPSIRSSESEKKEQNISIPMTLDTLIPNSNVTQGQIDMLRWYCTQGDGINVCSKEDFFEAYYSNSALRTAVDDLAKKQRYPQNAPANYDQLSSQDNCISRLSTEFTTLLNETYKNEVSPTILKNQHEALLKALYPESYSSITNEEQNSLTQDQMNIIGRKNRDEIEKEIDEVLYKQEILKQKLDFVYRAYDLYQIRLICGHVTGEEQIAHELQELRGSVDDLVRELRSY